MTTDVAAQAKQAAHRHERAGRDPVRAATTAFFKHAILIAATFAMLYPLLWMIASSFKPESAIFTDLSIWPHFWDLSNYTKGWTALNEPFSVYFLNSTLVALVEPSGY